MSVSCSPGTGGCAAVQRLIIAVAVAIGIGSAVPAPAEILDVSGSARIELQEFLDGSPRDSNLAFDSYPGSQTELPIQVVVRLDSPDADAPAAASGAAQFADPQTSGEPNPSEFAVNLALNSRSSRIGYESNTRVVETRVIRFAAGEIDADSIDGGVESLFGRLFLDGALAVFADSDEIDLTGTNLTVRVTIGLQQGSLAEEAIFTGAISVIGQPAGEIDVTADGAFPVDSLVLSDLGGVLGGSEVFLLLVLPNLEIDFVYDVIVGQRATLTAVLEVEAASAPLCGVAAVLGTPTDAINEVISITESAELAGKVLDEIQRERANPTGALAADLYDLGGEPRSPLLPLCGLFGFEWAAGLALLGGWRVVRR